jgi:hypothetical protein
MYEIFRKKKILRGCEDFWERPPFDFVDLKNMAKDIGIFQRMKWRTI